MKKNLIHDTFQAVTKTASAQCDFFKATFTTEISRIRFNRMMRDRQMREQQQQLNWLWFAPAFV